MIEAERSKRGAKRLKRGVANGEESKKKVDGWVKQRK